MSSQAPALTDSEKLLALAVALRAGLDDPDTEFDDEVFWTPMEDEIRLCDRTEGGYFDSLEVNSLDTVSRLLALCSQEQRSHYSAWLWDKFDMPQFHELMLAPISAHLDALHRAVVGVA